MKVPKTQSVDCLKTLRKVQAELLKLLGIDVSTASILFVLLIQGSFILLGLRGRVRTDWIGRRAYHCRRLGVSLKDPYCSAVSPPVIAGIVSRPQPKSNQLEDRVMSNNSQGKEQKVEDHRRNFKFSNNKTSVTACNDSLNAKTLNVNFVCVTCGKCVLNENHDLCVLHYINGVNSRTRKPMVVPISTREPKQNVNQSVATSSKKTVATDSTVKKSRNITRKLYEQVSKTCSWWYPKYTPPGYNWKPKSQKGNVNPNISMPLGNASRTANILEHKTPRCSTVSNTPLSSNSFAARTVKFGNDQIAPILGYGDLVQGTITIKRVYYVEGLNHNLFSVGQLCDADLEVAFRKSTCYIRDLKGNDLLTGSRGTDLYSITLQDLTTPNPICLMAKATSSQAWLWHRRLSHLNFDTINLLSKNNIVNGLPKLKFVKDHLCSSCELGKAKRKSFLHMDLCVLMQVESINGKKYVLVIVDDYSRYTWTHFLRSKDETPGVLIDFLTLVQRGLHAQVTTVRTDKGTEFLNKTLHAYFAKEGIRHETSTARTPKQNGVVERRNRTLVEAARTMLSAAKVPLFFWAEAIATTKDVLLKTDVENLDKMKEKGDACIFVGYSTQSKLPTVTAPGNYSSKNKYRNANLTKMNISTCCSTRYRTHGRIHLVMLIHQHATFYTLHPSASTLDKDLSIRTRHWKSSPSVRKTSAREHFRICYVRTHVSEPNQERPRSHGLILHGSKSMQEELSSV
ncbi:retrovirus-related pol polyprotein from transposon TNT 1-94 [Tanacetum coccineum]